MNPIRSQKAEHEARGALGGLERAIQLRNYSDASEIAHRIEQSGLERLLRAAPRGSVEVTAHSIIPFNELVKIPLDDLSSWPPKVFQPLLAGVAYWCGSDAAAAIDAEIERELGVGLPNTYDSDSANKLLFFETMLFALHILGGRQAFARLSSLAESPRTLVHRAAVWYRNELHHGGTTDFQFGSTSEPAPTDPWDVDRAFDWVKTTRSVARMFEYFGDQVVQQVSDPHLVPLVQARYRRKTSQFKPEEDLGIYQVIPLLIVTLPERYFLASEFLEFFFPKDWLLKSEKIDLQGWSMIETTPEAKKHIDRLPLQVSYEMAWPGGTREGFVRSGFRIALKAWSDRFLNLASEFWCNSGTIWRLQPLLSTRTRRPQSSGDRR